jgi:hypothetical protein
MNWTQQPSIPSDTKGPTFRFFIVVIVVLVSVFNIHIYLHASRDG